MTVEMAKATLLNMGLSVGNISSSASIQDTAVAFVIMQTPSAYSTTLDSLGMPLKNSTMQGGSIDLVIDKVAPAISKRDSIK
jgi:hypothetical protein